MGHSTNCMCVVIALSVCLLICESEDQEKKHLNGRTVFSSTVALVEDKNDNNKGKQMGVTIETSNLEANDKPSSSLDSEDTITNRNTELPPISANFLAKSPVTNAVHSVRTSASMLSVNHKTELKSESPFKTLQQNRQIDGHVQRHGAEKTNHVASVHKLRTKNPETRESYISRTNSGISSEELTNPRTQDISGMPETSSVKTLHSLSNRNQNNASIKTFINNIKNMKSDKTASRKGQTDLSLPLSFLISEPKLSKRKIIARTKKPKKIAKRSTNELGNYHRTGKTNSVGRTIRQLADKQKTKKVPSSSKDNQKPLSQHVTKPSDITSSVHTLTQLKITASDASQKSLHKKLFTTRASSISDLDSTSVSGSYTVKLTDREADNKCSQSGTCLKTTSSLSTDAYWAAGSLLTVLLTLTLAVLYTGLLKKRNTFDNFSFSNTNGAIEMDDMKPAINIKDLLKKIPHLSGIPQHVIRSSRRQRSKHFQGNKYRRLPNLSEHDSDDLIEEEEAERDQFV